MGKSELEHAASMLVRACQLRGDTWAPVAIEEMRAALTQDVEAKRNPFCRLLKNTFFVPDFPALIGKGFARWSDGDNRGAIELTDKGIEALRWWVQKGQCARCHGIRHEDKTPVTWKCQQCGSFVCRVCTLTIPGRVPREYFEKTLCSQACWEAAGSPKE